MYDWYDRTLEPDALAADEKPGRVDATEGAKLLREYELAPDPGRTIDAPASTGLGGCTVGPAGVDRVEAAAEPEPEP